MTLTIPNDVIQVAIGIQARSTSRRFPRKVFEMIGDKMMIQHVMEACEKASHYLGRWGFKTRINTTIRLLVPEGDELLGLFSHRCITGPEHDVLTRYVNLQKSTGADFVVRVTGDCPLIPHFIISKAITYATKENYEYFSNVQENARTSADGFDVEVMSALALDWANKNAKSPSDREHVTTILRGPVLPPNFRVGHMLGHIRNPQKLSVDTPEDLEVVRDEYKKIQEMKRFISKLPGINMVHRY